MSGLCLIRPLCQLRIALPSAPDAIESCVKYAQPLPASSSTDCLRHSKGGCG